jgi:hypothetical protein
MVDTAKRLAGPVILSTSGATYYTVPAVTTTIVRNIHVSNATATAATLTLGIGGVTAAQSLYFGLSVPANGSLDWSGFLPLAAGETLQALAGTVTALSMTVAGVEVT